MGTANCLVSESGHSVVHQPGHSRNSILFEKFGLPSGRGEYMRQEPRLDMNEGLKLGS